MDDGGLVDLGLHPTRCRRRVPIWIAVQLGPAPRLIHRSRSQNDDGEWLAPVRMDHYLQSALNLCWCRRALQPHREAMAEATALLALIERALAQSDAGSAVLWTLLVCSAPRLC